MFSQEVSLVGVKNVQDLAKRIEDGIDKNIALPLDQCLELLNTLVQNPSEAQAIFDACKGADRLGKRIIDPYLQVREWSSGKLNNPTQTPAQASFPPRETEPIPAKTINGAVYYTGLVDPVTRDQINTEREKARANPNCSYFCYLTKPQSNSLVLTIEAIGEKRLDVGGWLSLSKQLGHDIGSLRLNQIAHVPLASQDQIATVLGPLNQGLLSIPAERDSSTFFDIIRANNPEEKLAEILTKRNFDLSLGKSLVVALSREIDELTEVSELLSSYKIACALAESFPGLIQECFSCAVRCGVHLQRLDPSQQEYSLHDLAQRISAVMHHYETDESQHPYQARQEQLADLLYRSFTWPDHSELPVTTRVEEFPALFAYSLGILDSQRDLTTIIAVADRIQSVLAENNEALTDDPEFHMSCLQYGLVFITAISATMNAYLRTGGDVNCDALQKGGDCMGKIIDTFTGQAEQYSSDSDQAISLVTDMTKLRDGAIQIFDQAKAGIPPTSDLIEDIIANPYINIFTLLHRGMDFYHQSEYEAASKLFSACIQRLNDSTKASAVDLGAAYLALGMAKLELRDQEAPDLIRRGLQHLSNRTALNDPSFDLNENLVTLQALAQRLLNFELYEEVLDVLDTVSKLVLYTKSQFGLAIIYDSSPMLGELNFGGHTEARDLDERKRAIAEKLLDALCVLGGDEGCPLILNENFFENFLINDALEILSIIDPLLGYSKNFDQAVKLYSALLSRERELGFDIANILRFKRSSLYTALGEHTNAINDLKALMHREGARAGTGKLNSDLLHRYYFDLQTLARKQHRIADLVEANLTILKYGDSMPPLIYETISSESAELLLRYGAADLANQVVSRALGREAGLPPGLQMHLFRLKSLAERQLGTGDEATMRQIENLRKQNSEDTASSLYYCFLQADIALEEGCVEQAQRAIFSLIDLLPGDDINELPFLSKLTLKNQLTDLLTLVATHEQIDRNSIATVTNTLARLSSGIKLNATYFFAEDLYRATSASDNNGLKLDALDQALQILNQPGIGSVPLKSQILRTKAEILMQQDKSELSNSVGKEAADNDLAVRDQIDSFRELF